MLIDDDVYLRPGDLSRFFSLCEHYQTYLAQPALRWFTHTTLNSLVRNPACVLRRVTFVEVMAPTFSAAALQALIPTFGMTRSTWGTDVAWAGTVAGQHPIYVVDAIAMDHTRTGDGWSHGVLPQVTEMGVDPGALRRRRCIRPSALRAFPTGHVFRPGIPRPPLRHCQALRAAEDHRAHPQEGAAAPALLAGEAEDAFGRAQH